MSRDAGGEAQKSFEAGKSGVGHSNAEKLVIDPMFSKSLLPHRSAFDQDLSSQCPYIGRVTHAGL